MNSFRDHWKREWGTSTYAEYHRRIVELGTTPNGVFGTKIHAGQFQPFLQLATGRPRIPFEERSAIVAEWFPSPQYVWLRRRDQVGQAVSWAKACQTKMWWDADEAPAPFDAPEPDAARFDYHLIERSLYALHGWDGVWRTYFDATDIEPLTVWYEDLVADRSAVIRRVLDYLGLSVPADFEPPSTAFRRQSDGTSATWAERYVALEAVRSEATLASLRNLHAGQEIVVVTGGRPEAALGEAITVAVDDAAFGWAPSYAVLTRTPAAAPLSDVVILTGTIEVEHPFVIRCLLSNEARGRNRLTVAGDDAEAIGIAVARHLGGSRIRSLIAEGPCAAAGDRD